MVILAPMVQVGCRRARSGVIDGEVRRRQVEERPARGGEHQARDARRRFADEALPDGRVLRVDRPQPGERRGQRVAADRPRLARRPARGPRPSRGGPPATSVSLLAVATTLPARSAASVGRSDTTPPVPTITRSTSSRVASSTSASSPRTRRHASGQVELVASSARATALGLRRRGLGLELRGVAARGEGDDLEPVGVGLEDLDRLPADAPGRAEQRDAERARRQRTSATTYSATTGPANRNESIRSSIPPWPGIRAPESFAPAARLSIDSARSPAWAARPSSGPRTRPPSGFWPSRREHQHGHDGARDQPADETLDRLRRRDVGEELVASDLPAHEVGAGVVAPDAEDEQQDPAALRADLGAAAPRRGWPGPWTPPGARTR